MTTEARVILSGRPLKLGELLAIADGHRVELSDEATASINESRAVVEAALVSGEAIYGVNTGLGHSKVTRLPEDQLQAFQELTIKAHAGAIGPSVPTRVVRAAMAVRVQGMARGGAGATLACVETLVAMLNAGVSPIVPESGSIGAADLAQMAAIALVAIGGGEAEFRGETLPGSEALRKAGIPALRPQPKDGVAMIAANGIAVGHGAVVAQRARADLELATLAALLSLEAILGNPSIFDPAVAEATARPGQAEVSGHFRSLLRGSGILDEGTPSAIQDPLSFRVLPQVHGAVWEFVELAWKSVEDELNAMTDNPLVSRRERRVIHNGNFHPMVLALAFDALRPALAHLGQLSDRRLNHLWAATYADPALVAWGSPKPGVLLRYAAAAEYAELRQLAGPATLDIPPLDLGIEDHGTGAPISVRRTEAALDHLEAILAVELLMARDLLKSHEPARRIGAGATSLMAVLDLVVGNEASARKVHELVLGAARAGRLRPAL
jgi:histidine ammonia-lyase